MLNSIVGETLRDLRTSKGWTLRQLQARSFVSLGYMSEVERGVKDPSSAVLESITSALGVSLSGFYREVADRLELREARVSELAGMLDRTPARV